MIGLLIQLYFRALKKSTPTWTFVLPQGQLLWARTWFQEAVHTECKRRGFNLIHEWIWSCSWMCVCSNSCVPEYPESSRCKLSGTACGGGLNRRTGSADVFNMFRRVIDGSHSCSGFEKGDFWVLRLFFFSFTLFAITFILIIRYVFYPLTCAALKCL